MMTKHRIREVAVREERNVLEWELVVENEHLRLQCCKPGETVWRVLHIGPEGKLYCYLGIPDNIGLDVTDKGRIELRELC